MKTDNEYPATHSMSTAWFGIDKDGNVALIDFNENGPVPFGCGEWCPDDLISDKMAVPSDDGISNMNYTVEQANELEKRLKVPTIKALDFVCIVKVPAQHKELFKQLCRDNVDKDDDWSYPYITMCEETGLYKVDFYDWKDSDKKSLLDSNIIMGICDAEIYTNDGWDKEKNKSLFINEMDGYPYYLYQQPYWTGQLTELTYIPKFPIKADQLSETARDNALHFPFSFEEKQLIQIAELFHCESRDCKTESIHEGIREITKTVYPSSDNGNIIVRNEIIGNPDCKLCGKCSSPENLAYKLFAIRQYGLSPTILAAIYPTDHHYYSPSHYKEWFDQRSNLERMIAIPVIAGIPIEKSPYLLSYDELEQRIKQQNVTQLFANCRENFEENVKAIFPRVIIATEQGNDIIKDFYKIADNTIEIGGTSYPYFVMTEGSDHIAEIEALSKQPYRGVVVQRIERTDKEASDD